MAPSEGGAVGSAVPFFREVGVEATYAVEAASTMARKIVAVPVLVATVVAARGSTHWHSASGTRAQAH